MSVIIKDAKAPKNCAECWYSKGVYCLYPDTGGWVGEYQKNQTKPSWCPLVELPDKHGRLIDADELLKWYDNMRKDEVEKLRESKKPSIRQKAMHKIEILDKLYFEIYDRQKTVIEAEGEK